MNIAIVVPAGLLGGALNTMAAGGGVVTFLALLLTGMPPQVAIATSQVAIPASFLGGARRAWRDRAQYRPVLGGLVAAAAGTGLGVWLVSRVDAHTFRRAAPVLLLVAATLLLLQPHLPRMISRWRAGSTARGRRLAVALALFGTAIYGGAFGGGVAVAVLVVFAALTPWTWHRSNTTKNVVCLVMSVVCSGAFALTGLVAWAPAAALAGSQLAGGMIGVALARRMSADTLRRTVAVVTVLGAVTMAGSG
jgi:uncharacterized membrane protein YfcA